MGLAPSTSVIDTGALHFSQRSRNSLFQRFFPWWVFRRTLHIWTSPLQFLSWTPIPASRCSTTVPFPAAESAHHAVSEEGPPQIVLGTSVDAVLRHHQPTGPHLESDEGLHESQDRPPQVQVQALPRLSNSRLPRECGDGTEVFRLPVCEL